MNRKQRVSEPSMTRPAPKKEDLILAIDSGTQSIRAGLVNCSGHIIDLVKTEIEPYYSRQPGWAEQDPNYYWEKLCVTLSLSVN